MAGTNISKKKTKIKYLVQIYYIFKHFLPTKALFRNKTMLFVALHSHSERIKNTSKTNTKYRLRYTWVYIHI